MPPDDKPMISLTRKVAEVPPRIETAVNKPEIVDEDDWMKPYRHPRRGVRAMTDPEVKNKTWIDVRKT